MEIAEIPKEFVDDIRNKKNPQQRYYMAKIVCWKPQHLRPLCRIV
jgi:hypothetical protein